MVIEVLTEVAHGAFSVVHRDLGRLAPVIPVAKWGWMVGWSYCGAKERMCEKARLHSVEAMCFCAQLRR